MKFKVIGSNRETGARVTLELEANNRAMAERTAMQSNVEVLHIEQVFEGDEQPHGSRHRGEFEPGGGMAGKIVLFVIVAGVLVAGFMYWGKIRSLFP